MSSKNIAAFTKHHNDQPGFISINERDHGEIEIIIREDGDYNKLATITLSNDEFNQLVGQIVRSK